ncbi:MAG TPA: Rrf2 family transcriptional regulator [Bacteroidales bacterium]|nr:Rrf2 family transcriptional regulator [Bacteroidales bacterium]HNS46253.1 Rrf2 family transcriptional regulator [Bacteroidales bacterium]
MFLNQTTQYALQVLIAMSRDTAKVYTAQELYGQLHVPLRYLRRLLTNLTKMGYTESMRGRSGGFKLSQDSKNKTLAEIINSFEPLDLHNSCFFGMVDCEHHHDGYCILHDPWQIYWKEIIWILQTTTLRQVFTAKKSYKKIVFLHEKIK